ncbi:hypothetical protein F5B20DRAFT_548676 [Whalleya microplaca]|nr:hypothetical protein F5B20DRAFT_548676 [Whalleya microplaca]
MMFTAPGACLDIVFTICQADASPCFGNQKVLRGLPWVRMRDVSRFVPYLNRPGLDMASRTPLLPFMIDIVFPANETAASSHIYW